MRNSPKFNKQKCMECKYHAEGTAGWQLEKRRVYCNFAILNSYTCLKRGAKGTAVDIRGENYEKCKLFSKGAIIHEESRSLL